MGKKHKKKVYTTPKKTKHIHKKQSVENFISSFNNLKCEKCNSIMANHDNRIYCGKCCISIFYKSYSEENTY